MHCFTHAASSAVGICKFCGKGLCSQCATDTGVGLACHDSCEKQVETMGRIVANNARIMRTANAQNRSHAILGLLMGGLFLGLGALCYFADQKFLTLFLGGMGVLMFGHALLRLTADRYPDPES